MILEAGSTAGAGIGLRDLCRCLRYLSPRTDYRRRRGPRSFGRVRFAAADINGARPSGDASSGR